MATSESQRTRLLFLGTGAADWVGNPPKNPWQPGEWRRMSTLLVNDHILIDCGPTLLESMAASRVDVRPITDLLLTHSHDDHLSETTLLHLVAMQRDEPPLRLWGHPAALEQVPAIADVSPHPLNAGDCFEVAPFQVEALLANHLVEDTGEDPLHYLFTSDSVRWLYATDGAWLPTETWRRLMDTRLDAVVWDATIGGMPQFEGNYRIFEHNSLDMIRLMLKTLRQQGVLKPQAQVFLTHMARTLQVPHDELERQVAGDGMIPAYDGLSVYL